MEKLISFLIKENKKIATAESCTGGLLASKITDISGASQVFEMGIISYSNRIKNKELGVPKEILEKYGAVSEETVKAMSRGILKKADADIGVSVSGIAGPTGGTPQKPVGTVWISFCFKENGENPAYLLNLSGNRQKIRNRTCDLIIEKLKKYYNL